MLTQPADIRASGCAAASHHTVFFLIWSSLRKARIDAGRGAENPVHIFGRNAVRHQSDLEHVFGAAP